MPLKALIVIDMLNDFVDEKGALYCGKESRAIIPFIQERLSLFRKNQDLIVFLQDSHKEDDKEFEQFPRHGVIGTWGNQIIAELSPKAGEKIIPKTRYSGFYGTDLEKVLQDNGVSEAEVVGVCTSICVMDTVGGLVNRDHRVTVPIKGVADFDSGFHAFALKRMKQLYGANVE
jgi:nicotinamidase-related amidase